MIDIRQEAAFDAPARESLLDAAFGTARWTKTSERLRAGRLPAEGLSFVAMDAAGGLIGTVRLWHVAAGRRPALLLGPLAVAARTRSMGVGAALMQRALGAARAQGHAAVLLVGDAPYYGRFGFTSERTRALRLPGPYEPDRLLALELVPGAIDGARGLVQPTGLRRSAPARAARRLGSGAREAA